jgi:glutamate N-acetyltransferase/amino-acid N-acetyltransferase
MTTRVERAGSVLVTDEQLAAFSLAPGFQSAAVACGLKKSGALDLAMVWTDTPCTAAGVFTTNRVQAAPVLYDRETLAASGGWVRGVIANAGCANAVTGARGRADAAAMAARAAASLGVGAAEMLVLSTGVIGVFLDMEKLERGIGALHSDDGHAAAADAARAITTTDTRAKIATTEVTLKGGTVHVAGFAKGAGMIHPQMATMLAVLTTDARIAPPRLERALQAATERSFNRISVDGDMSTNDTVLVLASGVGTLVDAAGEPAFTAALADACASLAKQIARDGEGATRLVELRITGATSEEQAHRVGDTIATSSLVKTAIHGKDPNWGRILAAAGRSGEAIDPDRVRLWFGDGDAVQLLADGMPLTFDHARASALLGEDPVAIHVDLGLGAAGAVLWTCDLSADYVRINADYTT